MNKNILAMTKVILLKVTLLSLGCSTLMPKTEDLQKSPTCQVWKNGAMGSKIVATVQGERTKQKQTCWIMNMFGCTYNEYKYQSGGQDIAVNDKTIARIEGQRISSISIPGVTVDPIDLKNNLINYELKGPIGPKQAMTVEHNESCTKRQVAVGLMSIITR